MSGWRKRQIMEKIMETTMNDYFEFLDALRESGKTNMFGAGPYLMQAFGIDKREAKDIVLKWMETFSERHAT